MLFKHLDEKNYTLIHFNGAKFTDKGCTENLEQEALGKEVEKLKRVLSWRKRGGIENSGPGVGA